MFISKLMIFLYSSFVDYLSEAYIHGLLISFS